MNYYYPCVIDEETEPERSSEACPRDLSRVTRGLLEVELVGNQGFLSTVPVYTQFLDSRISR